MDQGASPRQACCKTRVPTSGDIVGPRHQERLTCAAHMPSSCGLMRSSQHAFATRRAWLSAWSVGADGLRLRGRPTMKAGITLAPDKLTSGSPSTSTPPGAQNCLADTGLGSATAWARSTPLHRVHLINAFDSDAMLLNHRHARQSAVAQKPPGRCRDADRSVKLQRSRRGEETDAAVDRAGRFLP